MAKMNPYTAADHKLLMDTERKLHDLLPTVDDMQACGVDCSDWQAIIAETQEKLKQIRARFFTPPPSK